MDQTGKKPADRTWWIIGGVFLAFWATYLYFLAPSPPGLLDGPGPDQPADFNWTLKSLEGEPVSFTKFKGRTVFLNIWATWCPPCVSELPSIAKLAAMPSLKGKDIAFVCVATDQSIDAVRRFVRDKSWPMTVLHADELPAVFLTQAIPATFIIAPEGKVVAGEVGAAQWDDPKVVTLLDKIARPVPSPTETPRSGG